MGKKDVGETDRIYDVYTLEQGKISAIARGVRKPQAKLAGHLENFYLVDLTVMKNRGLGNISGSIVENNFQKIHQDLDNLNEVFSVMKIFRRLVNNEEKDERIFELLLNYLQVVDELSFSGERKILQRNLFSEGFLFKLLELLGYKIQTSKCVVCGGKLSADKNFFDYDLGGTACLTCSSRLKTTISIGNNAIKIIRIFFQNELKDLKKLKISQREINELKRVSQTFIKWTF